jgi:EH domain-containing protein 1
MFPRRSGILAGEKQRTTRGYDFTKVCKWFAERSDLILLLFDAHKLDISDEFRVSSRCLCYFVFVSFFASPFGGFTLHFNCLKLTIESLKGMDDKVRCILNKADQIDRQKLMRV